MAATEIIAVRVSKEEKNRLLLLAEREQVSASALLKRSMGLALLRLTERDETAIHHGRARAQGCRFSVRLGKEDLTLLDARAEARGMPAATYASVLLRAHLRDLRPLPVEELRALKLAVAELGAVGRNLNQIARHLNQGGMTVSLSRFDLMGLLRVCEGLCDKVKALIRANVESWESGNANPND